MKWDDEMKTEKEIRKKIDELLNINEALEDDKGINCYADSYDEHDEMIEANCNKIDALLWVIGDRSGKPI